MLTVRLRPGETLQIGRNVDVRVYTTPGERGSRVTIRLPDGVSVIRETARVKLPARGEMVPDED